MPNIADARKLYPELDGLNDNDAVDVLHQNLYADLPRADLAKFLGVAPPAPPPPPPRGVGGYLKDIGIAAARGIIGVPEAAVGIADLVSGGQAGKLVEQSGVRFKDAKDILAEYNTPQQKAANQAVNETKGFFPTVGAMLENPSTIVNQAVESAPSMLVGGAMSRAALAAVPRMGAIAAGALGEGSVAAGQNAEQVRQEDPNGTLTAKQSAILAASGVLTGGLSLAAGSVANKLGIGDVQTMLASGKLGPVGSTAIEKGATKGVIRRVAEGAATEGVLQELPQSYQEQVAQNIAQDKPWDEGAAEAGAQGMMAGGLMGVGGNVIGGHAATPATAAPPAGPLTRATDTMPPGTTESIAAAQAGPVDNTPGVNPEDDPIMARIDALPGGSREEAGKAYAVLNNPKAPVGVQKYNKGLLDRLLSQDFQDNLAEQNKQAEQDTQAQAATESIAKTKPVTERIDPETGEVKRAYDERQADAPKQQEGDILNLQGIPFTTFVGAKSRQKELGNDYQVIRLAGTKYVVRAKPAEAVTTPAAPDVGPAKADAPAQVPTTDSAVPAPVAEPVNQPDALNVQNTPPASTTQAQTPADQAPEAGAPDPAGQTAAGTEAGNAGLQTAGVADAKPAPVVAEPAAVQAPATDTDTKAAPANPEPDSPALQRIAKGTAYFASIQKGNRWIVTNGLKDTHTLQKSPIGANRWDVVPKQSIKTQEQTNENQRTEQQPAGSQEVGENTSTSPAEGATSQADATTPVEQAQATPEKIAPVAKPKGMKQVVAARIAQRADYFTPGNVVKSYGGHDEVVSYTPPDTTGGNWSVKVRAVVQKDGQWVPDPKDNRERIHSTPPDTKELAKGPVLRAETQKVMPNQPPAQQSSAPNAIESVAAPVSDVQTTDAPTIHSGLKIYPIKVKVGDEVKNKWAVQTLNNAEREKNGERQLGGDPLADTLEGAKALADGEVESGKQIQEYRANMAALAEKQKAADAITQAKKDANKGKSIAERRAEATLDKPTNLPMKAGLGIGTRREAMQKAVEQGRYIARKMVPDTAAKKRDEDYIYNNRRLPMGNINYPGVKAYLEVVARKNADNYEKPDYRLHTGQDENSSFYEISKTEYDFAQMLLEKPVTAPDKPAPVNETQDPVAQRANAARAEEVRKKRASRLRGYTYAKSPFLAFLGKYGVALSQRRDFSPDNNLMLSGYGPMFRNNGKTTDLLVQNAIEENFLPEGATSDDLDKLISQQISGMGTGQTKRIEAIYSPEVADRVMNERMDSAQQAYQDELAAQQEAAQNEDFDPFESVSDIGYAPQDAQASGYTDAEQALQLEVNALLLSAEKQGVDTQEIKDQAYDNTREGTVQDYLEAARAALQAAVEGSNGDSSANAGQPVNAGSQEGLTAPTPADILAQQQAKADGEKANASQRRTEQERLRREQERKDIAKASEAAADSFVLGGNAEQNLSGQGGLFDEPAKADPVAETKATRTGAQGDGGRVSTPGQDSASGSSEGLTAPVFGIKLEAGKNTLYDNEQFNQAEAQAKTLQKGEFTLVTIDRVGLYTNSLAEPTRYGAWVSNGDTTATFVDKNFPASREPLTDADVAELYKKATTNEANRQEKIAKANKSRLDLIESKKLRIGTSWAGAQTYVAGKTGITTFSNSKITGIDPSGFLTVESSLRGSNRAYKFTVDANSRLFDNYPTLEGLTTPTQQEVLDQQDRKGNAQALDQKEQVDREAAGQTLTSQTAPEQRTDTSGDMFAMEKAVAEIDKRKAGKAAKADPNQGGMFDEPASKPDSSPIKAGDVLLGKDGLEYTVVDVYGNTVDAERVVEQDRGNKTIKGITLTAIDAVAARQRALTAAKNEVGKDPDQGGMFSIRDSAPEKQLSLKYIELLVKSALRGMKNAPTVRVVASPESIGLRPPVNTVPSGVTLANGDIYVFQSGIGSALDVDLVVFHELFHKGLQNVMPRADYVAAMLEVAKIDSKVRQYAGEWSDSNAGKAALTELAEKYSGQELADQYEALATEEGLARIAEDLKAKREMGSKDLRMRRLVAWLANLADKIGMTRLADRLRAMSYNEAEKFVIDTIGRAGGSTGGSMRLSSKDAGPEQNALQALSQTDELFALPKSDSKTVEGITADANAGIAVKRSRDAVGREVYNFTMPDGKTASLSVRPFNPYATEDAPTVFGYTLKDGEMTGLSIERPGTNPEEAGDLDDVWVDVSRLKPGTGGAVIYNIAQTYAHNTGRIFIGDPAGLSDDALRRRTEQMLSSALKFGTTAHLAPHPRQVEGDAKLGIPPLQWTYGDDLGNIQSLIETSLANYSDVNPLTFEPRTGRFLDSEGNELDRSSIRQIADSGPWREAGAGSTTLERAAIFESLVREESSQGGAGRTGAGLLERLLATALQFGASTNKVFYSRSTDPVAAAQSTQAVEKIVQGITSRWGNAPEVVVVSDMQDLRIPAKVRAQDLEQRSGGATGEPEGFYLGGKVYIVASQVSTPKDVARVVFHESLGHFGLRGVFGDQLKPILQQLSGLRRAEVAAKAKQYGLDMSNESQRLQAAEEVLAEMAQTRPDMGFVKRAVTIIRTWLRRNVPGFKNLALTDADIIQQFILPARGFVERGQQANVDGRVPAFSRAAVNELTESDSGGSPMFSRAAVSAMTHAATDRLNETFIHPGKLSIWDKTVGSMYHLAERSVPFKKVFTASQDFINDVSYYATEAADLAPKNIPKLNDWKDLLKSPISAADSKAIAAPINEGTLSWTRDEDGKPVSMDDLQARHGTLSFEEKAQMLLRKKLVTQDQLKRWQASTLDIYEGAVRNRFDAEFAVPGVVWSDAELSTMFGLNAGQIGLYREFRAAVDKSLDNLAKADLFRYGGKDVESLRDMVMEAKDVDEAAVMLRDYVMTLADGDKGRADELNDTANGMMDRADKVSKLKARGYAPLSRFGRYSVDVVVKGERQYFGLFESVREANKMAVSMRKEFGAAHVAQGTMSQKDFEQFQGITPESIELFGNMLGLSSTGDEAQDKAFQQYLKLTKNNRSAMKRLIHRKGIAGYNADVGRVLAAFVYSNARQTSAALHMGSINDAIQEIPKEQGELKDAAIELSKYIKEPREEAHVLRGLLFAQYLGGSIASAFVNFTQPLTVSFPYLSQFGGTSKAGAALLQAMKDQRAGAKLEAGLAEALRLAEEQGTVSPQSVHELMAQAQGKASLQSGDGTRTGEGIAFAKNNFAKLAMGWGKLFGLAEQVNRRSTFIAAYRLAEDQKIANPAAFATKAVDETQFISNKGNKAKFARGTIGGTLMTFKSYSVNYLELLHRMATQGGPEGKKAAALMLGMLFLMAGAGGLPFAEDLEDVADFFAQRLGYNFSSKKAKQEFLEGLFSKGLADFIDKGISGLPGSPVDTSGRMGMSNLIPGTGLLLKKRDHTSDVQELFGPAGDLVKRGFKAGDELLSGNVYKAARTIAPKALYNLDKGVDMASTGAYNDDKGYKVLEVTPFEAAMKAIGFQPAGVADVQQANYLNQRAKDFYSMHAQEIQAVWAKGLYEKDPDQVLKAREMVATWNEQNPEQKIKPNLPAIIKRAREMAKPKDQRIADTAPKAMRVQMRQEMMARRAEQE